jgi:hypothetical protein
MRLFLLPELCPSVSPTTLRMSGEARWEATGFVCSIRLVGRARPVRLHDHQLFK